MAKQKKLPSISAPLTCPLSQKKRILGLDLSLTGTGWCTSNILSKATNIADYGMINTSGLAGPERLDYIWTGIKEHLMEGTLVVIEDFSFGSKGLGLSEIHGLGWLIRYELWLNKTDYVLIPPTVLKKFATGKGNADKSIILKEVYKIWNIDLYNDNEADAFVLCMLGRALLHLDDSNLKTFQKEIIAKLCHDSKI